MSRSADAVAPPVGLTGGPRIEQGACYALFAYDVGFAIDLNEAEQRITTQTHRQTIRHRRRAPSYFEFRPAPLALTLSAEPVMLGEYRTSIHVDALLFDFGAISISFTIPIRGPFHRLAQLSAALYDNTTLLEESRRRVEELMHSIRPAISKPFVAAFVEDYAIYHVGAVDPVSDPADFLAARRQEVAQILRSEREPLSAQETEDALAVQIAFGRNDLAVIDWNAAFVFDDDPSDVRSVLEFANVELLEMRYLDDRLDAALAEAYDTLTVRPRRAVYSRRPTRLSRLAQMQVDAAMLFEGVNNSLKLLGDQYLARVYRLGSHRFHLAEWDASIMRKLQTLESIYQKVADRQANWRMEVLEWIIIVLIAVSIVVPFTV